jgi:Ca2+-binding RTX toxin-like protein
MITGGGGRDFAWGGDGNDTLNGGPGGDYRLWAGAGDDTVNGDAGPDWIFLGAGSDTGNGGAGDDHLFAAADDGAVDNIACGDGADRVVLRTGDVAAADCETVVFAS